MLQLFNYWAESRCMKTLVATSLKPEVVHQLSSALSKAYLLYYQQINGSPVFHIHTDTR